MGLCRDCDKIFKKKGVSEKYCPRCNTKRRKASQLKSKLALQKKWEEFKLNKMEVKHGSTR